MRLTCRAATAVKQLTCKAVVTICWRPKPMYIKAKKWIRLFASALSTPLKASRIFPKTTSCTG